MGETILMTGSTGFIGARLLDYLAAGGVRTRVFLRAESATVSLPEGVEIVRGSFSDPDSLGRAVKSVDRIVHLAGVTKALDEAGYDAGNVMPVRNLLAAVREHNPALKRFLLVSSLAAAGPSGDGTHGLRESDPPSPVSAYGRSKLRAEAVAQEFAAEIPLTIVRPPAVYGPGDRDVLQVFQMLAKGVLVSAGSSEKQRFSMIYVDDLVRGLMIAARSDRASGSLYYLTSSRAWSWDEVIAAARPVLGFQKLLRVPLPTPLVYFAGSLFGALGSLTGRPMLLNRDKVNELLEDYWVCSPEKATHELGFTAGTSLEEGVSRTIAWNRAQGLL